MSQDNRIRLPSGSAGITNFSDEYKSRLMVSPTGVMVFIAITVIVVILLNLFV